MNDQELARQIVAHLGGDGPNNYAAYSIVIDGIAHWMPAEKLVNDWRVAGAMMERCDSIIIGKGARFRVEVTMNELSWVEPTYGESLPRALNEACSEALS